VEADLGTKLAVTDIGGRHRYQWWSCRTWLSANIPMRAQRLRPDVTSALRPAQVQGPSHARCSRSSRARISDRCVPVPHRARVDAVSRRNVHRITDVGELDTSYTSAKEAPQFMTASWTRDANSGLVPADSRRSRVCALEKGYRGLRQRHRQYRCAVRGSALGFALAMKKTGGFIGQGSGARQKAKGPRTRRLVHVLVQDPSACSDIRRSSAPDGAPFQSATCVPHTEYWRWP